ncbi:hypothetical protein ZWY2020_058948 [Hordeum vulgare]|nr:hypothetical protein ZWY2020_058948 [Hordeum vulgare]
MSSSIVIVFAAGSRAGFTFVSTGVAMDFAVDAALWAVGKALAPVKDGLLESWAASTELGRNIDALKMQLLYAQGMLDSAQGKDIRSTALKELLHKLRELAYNADDVLDELEYFRIQDALDDTYHAAADVSTQGGFIGGLVLNARHTAYAVGKHFSCHSAPSVQDDNAHTVMLEEESPNTAGSGRRFFCGAWSSKARQRNQAVQTPKLKFDRVEMSRKMVEIVDQLKPLCAMVSTILNLLGSNRTTSKDITKNRPKTTQEIVEPEFYGRDDQKKEIVDFITHGEYCKDELTVVPLVGPGGIGCLQLTELPFSHPAHDQAKQEENMTWFPKLMKLNITGCPKLASLPPIPWTQAPCSAEIRRAGSVFEKLVYSKNYKSELSLEVEGKDGQHGLWNGLAFHNLAGLKELEVNNCPPLPLIHLQKLKSLKSLTVIDMSNSLLLFECESYNTECPLPVEQIKIWGCGADGKEMTQLLSYFPKLTELVLTCCEKITELGVVELQTEMTTPSSSGNEIEIEHAQAGHHQTRAEEVEEAVAGGEGLLLLPRQLQELSIYHCSELRLLSDSLGKDNVPQVKRNHSSNQRLPRLRLTQEVFLGLYILLAQPCRSSSLSTQEQKVPDCRLLNRCSEPNSSSP